MHEMRGSRLAEIEYENLYREIHDDAEKVYSILHMSIIATMTFFGFMLAADATTLAGFGVRGCVLPAVFLVPLIIILPSIVLITSRLNATVRCATYIWSFYETRPPAAPCWQWAVQQFRKCEQDKRKTESMSKIIRARFLGRALLWLLPSLGAVCIILSFFSLFPVWKECQGGISYSYIAAQGALMLIGWLGVRRMERAWSTKRFDAVMSYWQEIKGTAEKEQS